MKIVSGNHTIRVTFSTIIRGAIGVIGFILSPLSWWNDLFVNVPLSFAFAWAVGKSLSIFTEIHQWFFINLFVLGYFLSNLLGFLMIHFSIFGLTRTKAASFKKQILISFIYSAVVLAFFGLNICNLKEGCKVFPSWVHP